jgi:hypothetical protein
MKCSVRVLCLGACLAVWGVLAVETARAQVPNYGLDPSRRPVVSPYINLLRTGSSAAVNYYGIVRPEIAFGNAVGQLQGQQATLSNEQQDLATNAFPATGHKTAFMTQSKYFMSTGGTTQPATTFRSIGTTPPKSSSRPQ